VKCNKDKKNKPDFKLEATSVACNYLFVAEHIAGCGADTSILLGL